jgi:hypothetical protein
MRFMRRAQQTSSIGPGDGYTNDACMLSVLHEAHCGVELRSTSCSDSLHGIPDFVGHVGMVG